MLKWTVKVMNCERLGALLIAWMVCGTFIVCFTSRLLKADGLEVMNPKWLYYHTRLNALEAFLIGLLLNCANPVLSMLYWLYKLWVD